MNAKNKWKDLLNFDIEVQNANIHKLKPAFIFAFIKILP